MIGANNILCLIIALTLCLYGCGPLGDRQGDINQLFNAIELSDTEAIDQIVARNPGILDRKLNGRSVLHWVVNDTTARQLINLGADVNATNSHGDTPLHIASYTCNLPLMRLLINNGANINIGNDDKETPLHFAIAFEPLDGHVLHGISDHHPLIAKPRSPMVVEAVKLLIASGADTQAVSSRGWNAKDYADDLRNPSLLNVASQW